MKKNSAKLLLPVLIFFVLMQGCIPYKKVPYFTDIPENGDSAAISNFYSDPIIQKNDILKIKHLNRLTYTIHSILFPSIYVISRFNIFKPFLKINWIVYMLLH